MNQNETDCLPSSWMFTPLESVCLIIQGQSPPGETYNTTGKGLPFFQGKAEFGVLYPQPVKWCEIPTKIAAPDDILLSIRAPVGPTNLCPARACIGRGLAAIRPEGQIPVRYILYALSNTKNALTAKATGTTFEAVSGSDLRAHLVAVAPLSEQHRIVAEIEKQFSRLDAAVVALKRIKANLKRYRATVLRAACEGRLVITEAMLAQKEARDYEPASVLLQRILIERRARWEADQLAKMEAQGRLPLNETWKVKYQEPAMPNTSSLPELPEGWTWANVECLCRFVTSGSRGWAMYYAQSGAKFIRIGNLARGNTALKMKDIQYVQPPQNAEGERTRLQFHDVLISITANIGSVGLVPANIGEAYINQHIALCRPFCLLDARYIAWYLSCEGGQKRLLSLQRGATKVGLGLEDIKNVAVPLPPLAEQERIVAEVERRLSIVEEVEATGTANLKRAERMRQAILQKAFSGKLVPQAPADEPASVLLERIRAARETSITTSVIRRRAKTKSMIAVSDVASQETMPL